MASREEEAVSEEAAQVEAGKTIYSRAMNPRLFFNEVEKERVVAAIKEAETKTSGEIRLHIDKSREVDAMKRAKKVFEVIGMTRTKGHSGVLIYINSRKRSFAIIGDRGIHKAVDDKFWLRLAESMSRKFKDGEYLRGTLDTIDTIGNKLREAFPRRPDDANELRDTVSY